MKNVTSDSNDTVRTGLIVARSATLTISREDKGAKRINPPLGPLPINLSKVIFETFCFLADNISSRVAWKFRGGIKVQKHVERTGGRELR